MVEQATVGAKAPARIKTLLVKELVEDWRGTREFVVVCPIGLDGLVSNELRSDLVSKNVKMTVVKNAIARRAFQELDIADACDLLDQASAVCYGGESPVDVARQVVQWSKKTECFQIRGAFVDGRLFSAEEVQKLAAMPSRSELLSQIVGLIQSPGSRLASVLLAPAGRLAGALKALAEKLRQQSESHAPPAEQEQSPEQGSTEREASAQPAEDTAPEAAAEPAQAAPGDDATQPTQTAEPTEDAQKKDAAESASDSASQEPPSKDQQ